jgi:hypothetical protein
MCDMQFQVFISVHVPLRSAWQALSQNEQTGAKRGSPNRDQCFGAVGDRDAAPSSLNDLQAVIALTRAQSNLSNQEVTTPVGLPAVTG